MITCMKMKSFILKYASKIMFYDVNITCYQSPGDVDGCGVVMMHPGSLIGSEISRYSPIV